MTTASIPEQRSLGSGVLRLSGRVRARLGSSVYRAAVAVWMNVLIAAVAVSTVVLAQVLPQKTFPNSEVWAVGALKFFALWCFAFLPGWLYVRFPRASRRRAVD